MCSQEAQKVTPKLAKRKNVKLAQFGVKTTQLAMFTGFHVQRCCCIKCRQLGISHATQNSGKARGSIIKITIVYILAISDNNKNRDVDQNSKARNYQTQQDLACNQ